MDKGTKEEADDNLSFEIVDKEDTDPSQVKTPEKVA